MPKRDEILIAKHAYKNRERDFSSYLNAWDQLGRGRTLKLIKAVSCTIAWCLHPGSDGVDYPGRSYIFDEPPLAAR